MKILFYTITDSQYNWMMRNLPFRLMYKRVKIDFKYKMWFPRWGYSKEQKEKVEEKVKNCTVEFD